MSQYYVTYFLSGYICNLLEITVYLGSLGYLKFNSAPDWKSAETSKQAPSLKTVNMRLLDQLHHENSYSQFKNTKQIYKSKI